MRLSPYLSRRLIVAASVGAIVSIAAALALGPLIRHEVALEASKRRLTVQVTTVRPSWMGVRLLDVLVRADAMPGVELRAAEITLGLRWNLRPGAVGVRGASVVARGSEAELRAEFDAWREPHSGAAAGPGSGARPDIVVEDGSIRWEDGDGRLPRLDARNVSVELRSGKGGITFAEIRGRAAGLVLVATDGAAQWGPSDMLDKVHVATVTIEHAIARRASDSLPAEPAPPPGTMAMVVPPRAVAVSVGAGHKRLAPDQAPESKLATLALPDLQALRRKAAMWAQLVGGRVSLGAEVQVDALTWKVSSDEATALTIGPGPFSLTRTPGTIDLHFSTDPRVASTPLALGVVLPMNDGDVAATVDGGPLSLALLGVREGALGLVDVAQASATGRARIVLAADASALTFDVEGATRGLAVQNARLAADVVRGLNLEVRARGVLSTPGDLRLDEATVVLGAAQVSASGVLRQDVDHIEGGLHFEVPTVPCRALHDSFPAALLPALDGAQVEGTFGADGRLAFDSRALDDLALDYDVRDRCRFVDVPPDLARERFAQAFVHKVYLPDGTIGEQTTGPGTPNWTSIEDISPYMQVAVLTTEDGAFLRHHGFNRAAIRASIIANLKAGRFVRGASTITMQLAKNLFLSRDKTLARKLEEVVLAEYLEQAFSKDELMELYLNVIEFGPAVYGITSAADHYFGRTPAELNLAECLFLASVLPSPIRYGALRDAGGLPDTRMHGLRTLMEIAHRNGRIDDGELAEAEGETIQFWTGGDRPPPRAAVQPRTRFDGDSDDMTTVPPPVDDDPR
jgi:hypothetical protein